MKRGRRRTAAAAALLVLAAAESAAAAAVDRLRYIAVKGDRVLSIHLPDEPVNPASVVKMGTSLWALSVHGADHRFSTTFGIAGDWDRSAGVLHGDLVVVGGGDPDFQAENAFLVARELNRLGLRRIDGNLRVSGTFWCGWERGVEHRLTDPGERNRVMGRRLRAALDPSRWSRTALNSWRALAKRRGLDERKRPQLVIAGDVEAAAPNGFELLLIHRSNRLAEILRRFNVYSNNDIVRIAEEIGGVAALEAFLIERLDATEGQIELATASGELRNRMPVRLMVALLDALADEAATQGIELRSVLPVIGCDPGSTARMFPKLATPPLAGAVTCKTGTLTHTDGGVAVLAGVFTAVDGEPVRFAIAAPRAGRSLQHWRMLEQRWVLGVMADVGGARVERCNGDLPFSDTFTELDVVAADD